MPYNENHETIDADAARHDGAYQWECERCRKMTTDDPFEVEHSTGISKICNDCVDELSE